MADVDWEALDYSDPCALLAVLRPKYYALVAGSLEEEVEIDGRRVRFARTSLPQFKAVVKELESACAAQTSGRPKRRALSSRHYS